MVEFNYNPGSMKEKPRDVPPGIYSFMVIHMEPKVFYSKVPATLGDKIPGCCAHLNIFAPGRVVKAFENIFFHDKGLWKLKKLLECVGGTWDPDRTHQPKEFIQQSGQASFTRKKGNKYLEVQDFIMPESTSDQKPEAEPPPSVSDEDVPF